MTTGTYYSGAEDGYITGQNATYATARSTSTASDDTSTTGQVGQRFGAGQYFIMRAFLGLFDASAIPDDATVNSATLYVCADTDNSTTDFNVQVYRYLWASTLAGNREANYDGAYGGSATLEGTLRDTSAGWSSGTYYSLALDPAGISKTGLTGYTLASSRDISGTAPAGNEYVLFRTADFASTTSDPYIDVVYTPAASGQPTSRRLGRLPFRPVDLGRKTQGGIWAVPSPSVARLPGVARLAA